MRAVPTPVATKLPNTSKDATLGATENVWFEVAVTGCWIQRSWNEFDGSTVKGVLLNGPGVVTAPLVAVS